MPEPPKPDECPKCKAPESYLERVSELAWICNCCSRIFKVENDGRS